MPKSHEEDGHSADEEEPMLGTSGRSFHDAAASLKTATSKTDDNQAALWQELLRCVTAAGNVHCAVCLIQPCAVPQCAQDAQRRQHSMFI